MINILLNMKNMNECRESKINFELYNVFKNGEITLKPKNKTLSSKPYGKGGYILNSFRLNSGGNETFSRHRVIWYYFNGVIPNGMEIGHKDSNPTNNSIDNLYLCDRKENMRNPITRKRMEKAYKNTERNKKISEKLKGHFVSEEQKHKQSNSMKGKNLGIKRPEHSKIMKTKKRDALGRWIKKG